MRLPDASQHRPASGGSPQTAKACLTRGVALLKSGRYADAISEFDQAIRLDPAYGAAYGSRSRAKRLIGDIQGAKADQARAQELLRPGISR
jgi:tetratricopeptide (TPR) repeat protein